MRLSGKTSRLGKELIWIIFGQLAVVFGTLFGVRILTELMTPESYGELTLGLTLTTLVGQLIMGPLSNGVERFYSAALESSQIQGYFLAIKHLLSHATVIIFALSSLFVLTLFVIKEYQLIGLSIAAFSFALLTGYNTILSGIQNAARQRSVVALHQGLAAWTRFGFAAGFIFLYKTNSLAAMIGYNISMLFVVFSQLFFFKRIYIKISENSKDTEKYHKKWRSRILTYSWPYATWGIFTWAQLVSDRWALELFSNTREVGLYVVLYQMGFYPISLATNLLVQLITPIFSQRAGDASDVLRLYRVYTLNWRLTWAALCLTVMAFVVGWIFHGLIFKVFVAKEFSPISYLLPYMLLAGGLFATGQAATISAAMSTDTKSLLFPKIFTAILGLCLNLLGASHYGIIGVVAANVSFSLIYLVWILSLNAIRHRNLKRRIKRDKNDSR